MQRLKALGFVVLLATAKLSMAEECIELGVKERSEKYGSYGIREEGKYCVTADVTVNERSYLNHGWRFIYESSAAMGINASDVEIDLQSHNLTSKASKSNAPHGVSIFQHQNNIRIKNGTLRVIGKQGVGVIHNPSGSSYITIPSKTKGFKKEYCDVYEQYCEDISYIDGPDKLPPKYQDAHITIDNMNIFATYRGVQVADNHNTIRNSTIEVDDNNAIYLMGKYPVIENNTIIIHSNKNGDTETQKKYNIQIKDGAIKLRDAQGGIIRNNRIIYKAGLSGGKAPVAINLLDSKDVIIEGNTIEGFDKLVRENGDTSYTEKNNKIR